MKSTLIFSNEDLAQHCTEVRFASFLLGEFITAIVANPPERKLTKRTSVHCTEVHLASFLPGGFTAIAVINPPEKKLANRTSVCTALKTNEL